MARYNLLYSSSSPSAFVSGNRVLREAAAKDNYHLLNSLLNDYGDTYSEDEINVALTRACANGSMDCVQRLLDHGANPDSADTDGYTCLMLATANNYPEIAEVLLKAGGDINATSNNRRTALHVATWGNRTRILRLLLRSPSKCDVEVQDEYGDTAIMMAAKRGFDYPIRLLVRAKCNIQTKNDEKDTALHYAARHGHTKCVELLVKAGAEKEAKDMFGYTPIQLAAHMRKVDTVKLCLSFGCNFEERDRSGKTALHLAAEKGTYEAVEALLSCGADPNVAAYDGFSPLADVVFHQHNRTAIRLLKAGANASITCRGIIRRGIVVCSAFEVALVQKNLAMAYMLRACGCNTMCTTLLSHYPETLSQNEYVFQWYNEFANIPLRLGEFCRLSLRNVYGWKLKEYFESFQLPTFVRKLIAFEDFDEMLTAYEKDVLNKIPLD